MNLVILLLTITIVRSQDLESQEWVLTGNSQIIIHPCNGTDDIMISYELGRAPEEENQYVVNIRKELPKHSNLVLEFDSEAAVTLMGEAATSSRITTNRNKFIVNFFRPVSFISFEVQGPKRGTVPYFKSVKINTQEYCAKPWEGFLDAGIEGYKTTAVIELTLPEGCGRRMIQHTELIVNGEATKPGDWPWHVAIYRVSGASIKYICGGTLISKTTVLTAAHCATVRGVPVTPDILSVVLGKYNLIGGDLETQEREVHKVIVHEEFSPKKYLDNDIAFLKLKTEATYNDYVQPACIWGDKVSERIPPDDRDIGTVVGWGLDQTDAPSAQLKQATMPKVLDITCIKKNPLFYSNVLANEKKFCAGWGNGTSACNGDSGGGFMTFVPDTLEASSAAAGAYYVRGIVSISAARKDVALCDPHQHAVFTDVGQYAPWIQTHLDK